MAASSSTWKWRSMLPEKSNATWSGVMDAACGEIRSGTPPARNVNFIFFFCAQNCVCEVVDEEMIYCRTKMFFGTPRKKKYKNFGCSFKRPPRVA
jgi:hypothetical protein